MLAFNVIFRKGSEANGCTVKESYSADFTINGQSLLQILAKENNGHSDFIGCFARDWKLLNEHSLRQLLLEEAPETESGRCLLFVCPECADLACGAYGCKISKTQDTYIWSDFAYENDYEAPEVIEGLGPFIFSTENYESTVRSAYSI